MSLPTLILIEFNELSPTLLDEYMGRGQLPNFKRFYDGSTIFTTDAQEESPNLEPWIQWVTVHAGIPFSDHHVFHLGDGRLLDKKCVGAVLADAGIPVGIFGSLNQNYGRLAGYVLADPWDKEGVCHPAWLTPYYTIISRQVQESSKSPEISKAELLRFGAFMLRHGFSSRTARAAAAQLMKERGDRALGWRRAALLDMLNYDLFQHLNATIRPQFATFFSNSTAHFQHAYWRSMQPELFKTPSAHPEHASHRSAILYGYQAMDRLLGRFMDDYPQALLVLCTALSQVAWTDTNFVAFRPHRFDALMSYAGVGSGAVVSPVMSEQFQVDCEDETALCEAESRLGGLHLDGRSIMEVSRRGNSLFVGCKLNAIDLSMMDRPVLPTPNGRALPFGDLFYKYPISKTGRHHPDGALWVRTGRHRVVEEKVSLTRIAPTVLAKFGVARPRHMRDEPLAI